MIQWARKAMIRDGMSVDLDGIWRKEQLYSNLRQILEIYLENFEGENLNFPAEPQANM